LHRTWLWKTARGLSGEEVEDRLLPKSHGCGKTFPGPKALKNNSSVRKLTACHVFSSLITFSALELLLKTEKRLPKNFPDNYMDVLSK
jgi:hypothetical protein